jgi:hypothetical protein
LAALDALLGAENEFSLHLLKEGFNCRDPANVGTNPYSSLVNGWKTLPFADDAAT